MHILLRASHCCCWDPAAAVQDQDSCTDAGKTAHQTSAESMIRRATAAGTKSWHTLCQAPPTPGMHQHQVPRADPLQKSHKRTEQLQSKPGPRIGEGQGSGGIVQAQEGGLAASLPQGCCLPDSRALELPRYQRPCHLLAGQSSTNQSTAHFKPIACRAGLGLGEPHRQGLHKLGMEVEVAWQGVSIGP